MQDVVTDGVPVRTVARLTRATTEALNLAQRK
jgi:hypothetical protein